MRPARTPPEPAPMTKRSTSGIANSSPNPRSDPKSRTPGLDLVTPPLHLRAELGNDFVSKLVPPSLHILGALVENDRLLRDDLTAERRLVEREHILELLLGEPRCIEPGALVDDFGDTRGQLGAQLGGDLVEGPAEHGV